MRPRTLYTNIPNGKEEAGQCLAAIQQHQQQEIDNWNYLFGKLNFDPPV
jgi:hypothetical protein